MADGRLAAYQTVQTITAEPDRLVLMLFDGATRFLRQAGRALERRDVTAFCESVCRAHAIIAELSDALDRERGGEVAANLGRLYDFMLRHLTAGMTARSGRHLEEVLGPLAELRQGFERAMEATHA
jgi:flagellar protein FliS